jgi:hypothetical protein
MDEEPDVLSGERCHTLMAALAASLRHYTVIRPGCVLPPNNGEMRARGKVIESRSYSPSSDERRTREQTRERLTPA